MAVKFSSNYLCSRLPDVYGGKQEDYLNRSEEAISSTVDKIKDNSTGDLQKLFFSIIDDLGAKRKAIAVDHKYTDKDPQQFGHRRDTETGVPLYSAGLTGLYDSYKDYNTLILERFHKEVQQMPHDFVGFKEREHVLNDSYLGRKSSFKFQILEPKDLPRVVTGGKISAIIGQSLPVTKEDIYCSKSSMQAFKNGDPKLYTQDKLWSALDLISKKHPSPKRADRPDGTLNYEGYLGNLKSLFLHGTSRLEIDGKMYALSSYLTWLYCTHNTDPVDRMKKFSVVWVIHHDVFLIEKTLKDSARVFEQAVRWNQSTEDVQSLKDRIALLRYEFAHIMPFVRGSAAVGEWLETALYRYHGFLGMQHKSDKMGDLEALTALTLRQFMDRYESTIELGDRTAQ